jgi:hypothetical protein
MDDRYVRDLPTLDQLAGDLPAAGMLERLRAALQTHPAPVWGYVETALWLLVLFTIADHLFNPNGSTGTIVWVLTIGFHEIGHLLCNPFGTLIMFLGGTIWQVLVWVLVGAWEWWGRRRITVPLLCMAVAGHSLLNAAVYIGDAQTRDLPLLFGLSSDHHDWWNILSMTGLLPYDGAFAALTRIAGAAVVIAAAALGIYYAWVQPRVDAHRRRL